jgi:hypothetical protein
MVQFFQRFVRKNEYIWGIDISLIYELGNILEKNFVTMEYIISGIFGLIGGAIGSLVAPWVHWKIEVRKEQLKSKKELVFNLRTFLQKEDPRDENFLSSVDYIRIRRYLSNNFVKELEDFNKTILHSYHRSFYTAKFMEELDLIEDLWDLNLDKKGITKKSYQMQSGTTIIVSEVKD